MNISEAFGKMADAISANVPQADNEYIGEDGFKRCSVCHRRTETRIFVAELGIDKIVRCCCECKDREIDEQVRRRESDTQRRICFGKQTEMAGWTFENDDRKNAKLSDAMLRYAEGFSDFKKESKGLLLYGPVGTGKSFLAACIANRLIDKGMKVKMTNFSALINEIQATFDGKQEIIDDLNRYPLLIIDDLGVERQTEYMQEQVFNIIDTRYRAGLPMIVTTNLSIDEIKKPQDVRCARIYDRIIERCFPIEVAGTSRRRQNVRDTFDDVKARLGL